MDQEKIRDYTGPPKPEHLTFENQTLYHILSYTICPLAGMNTDGAISDVLRNTIFAISEGFVFDVEDMFLNILKDSAAYPKTLKVYAPWIQKVVDYSMKTEYLAKVSHKSFVPPVRDTLQVIQEISSGKVPESSSQDYHKEFDGPRLPKRDRMFTHQPPSQLEVSLRTQQLLLKHIAEDRQEKEHLAAELNAINNRTRIMHLIAAENKKRLWKLLRKFFSKKQLRDADLKELYAYIDKGLSVEDYQPRSTPPLPVREPTTDLLHINLCKLLEESEATSPTEKQAEGNVLSRLTQEVDPNLPSSSQHQSTKPEEKSSAAADDDLLVTSESETSSDSSSGDASE
jgi:hypothetical protein